MNRMSIEQFRARLAASTETGVVARLYRGLAGRPDPLRALDTRGEWVPWGGAPSASEAR